MSADTPETPQPSPKPKRASFVRRQAASFLLPTSAARRSFDDAAHSTLFAFSSIRTQFMRALALLSARRGNLRLHARPRLPQGNIPRSMAFMVLLLLILQQWFAAGVFGALLLGTFFTG